MCPVAGDSLTSFGAFEGLLISVHTAGTREVRMAGARSIGEPLRRALAGARLRDIDIAQSLGVDPKTVQRWLGGRVPSHRWNWPIC